MSIPVKSAWTGNLYLWDKIVAKWKCWEFFPDENTLLYLKMENDANDYSWNDRHWTNSWVVFWTYDWVKCWYFNWTAKIKFPWLWNLSQMSMIIREKTTNSLWTLSVLFMLSPSSNNKDIAIQWNSWTITLSRRYWPSWSEWSYNIQDWSANDWRWHCIMWTYDISAWADLYVDWVHIWHDDTYTLVSSDTNYNSIWWHVNSTDSAFRYYWYLSSAIIENRVLTFKQYLDYYNLTKSNYWY